MFPRFESPTTPINFGLGVFDDFVGVLLLLLVGGVGFCLMMLSSRLGPPPYL